MDKGDSGGEKIMRCLSVESGSGDDFAIFTENSTNLFVRPPPEVIISSNFALFYWILMNFPEFLILDFPKICRNFKVSFQLKQFLVDFSSPCSHYHPL